LSHLQSPAAAGTRYLIYTESCARAFVKTHARACTLRPLDLVVDVNGTPVERQRLAPLWLGKHTLP
jgi:hypothetical protein